MRIVCAMSGGVDSSVAAALLREAGHDVVGMTMRLYDASEDERRGRGGTCCSPAEIDAARDVCHRLGIPHYTVDERQRFTKHVIDPFARDYAAGRTPNPCTRCNQHVKFAPLLSRARALGADALATGHYARLEHGRLRRGVDPDKDQSYFLFAMGGEAARSTVMPLGEWTKDAVRRKAAALGLPNAAAPDSVELCFVPGGDHGVVVERRLQALGAPAGALGPGPVVDTRGEVVGEHDGIHRVTIGQRRGLRVRGHDRRYALRVIAETRTVVVGDPHEAEVDGLEIGEPTWLRDPAPGITRGSLHVQIRHRAAPVAAAVELDGRGGRVRVRFAAPVRAVAPGQAAVVYDGDEVLGGGWIASAT